MRLTWYGHSCFLLETAENKRLLTDPCDPESGYRLSGLQADAVAVSHDHHDHNYVKAVKGAPKIVKKTGVTELDGYTITGFPSYHDSVKGRQRGANVLFLIEAEGLRVLHLGDLGHTLPEATIAAIGPVDVLLCPIGGRFTIDAKEARAVTDALSPSVVIPMHYRTAACLIDIEGLAPFIKYPGEWEVRRLGDCSVEITKDALPEKEIWVLGYK